MKVVALLLHILLLVALTHSFPRASTDHADSRSKPRALASRKLQDLNVDEEDIVSIQSDVRALIDGTRTLAPKFVRLLFHDCVGGCNGCVDMANVSKLARLSHFFFAYIFKQSYTA